MPTNLLLPAIGAGVRMNCDLYTSLPDWVIDYPETETVLQELEMDIACQGKSLEYHCLQQRLDPEAVLQRLYSVINEHRTAGR